MDFSTNIFLENDTVLLRPLEVSDLQFLEQFVLQEPEIWKYSLVQIKTTEDLQKYICHAVEAREKHKEYPFIVFDKITRAYAGCTRFYDIQPAYQYLQIGYTWYGQTFQGTHLNKNCKLLLLEYAFEKLKMERVEFRADNRNERSKRAMLSIGCTVEGILRNHLPTLEGGRRESIVLSILKHEWENGVKENLIKKVSKVC